MSAPANGSGLHKPPPSGLPPNELNNSADVTTSPSHIVKTPSVPGSKAELKDPASKKIF